MGWLMAEVAAGLLAELLAEWGQDCGAGRPWGAVDELPAAGAFEQDDLVVEGRVPETECLGGGGDAGVPGDEQQPVQAAPGAGADQGAAEWFRQVTRVDARG